jgi:hypothetical protein
VTVERGTTFVAAVVVFDATSGVAMTFGAATAAADVTASAWEPVACAATTIPALAERLRASSPAIDGFAQVALKRVDR